MENQALNKPHKARGGKISSRQIATTAVGLVAVILSFAGGVQYQKHHQTSGATAATASAQGGQFGGQAGPGDMSGRMNDGTRVIGEVTAISDSSISVQDTRSGTTVTFTISSSTTVTDNGSAASVSDISTGDRVFITRSSSTSTAATAIALNASFGPGGASGGSTGTPDSATSL